MGEIFWRKNWQHLIAGRVTGYGWRRQCWLSPAPTLCQALCLLLTIRIPVFWACGNSSDTNKNRDFPEEQSSLQEELMKKFLSNSFLLSACFVPESVLHLIMCYLICCPQPMKEIVIIPVYRWGNKAQRGEVLDEQGIKLGSTPEPSAPGIFPLVMLRHLWAPFSTLSSSLLCSFWRTTWI